METPPSAWLLWAHSPPADTRAGSYSSRGFYALRSVPGLTCFPKIPQTETTFFPNIGIYYFLIEGFLVCFKEPFHSKTEYKVQTFAGSFYHERLLDFVDYLFYIF